MHLQKIQIAPKQRIGGITTYWFLVNIIEASTHYIYVCSDTSQMEAIDRLTNLFALPVVASWLPPHRPPCSYQLRGTLTQPLTYPQSLLVKSDAACWRHWSWRQAPLISTAYAHAVFTRVYRELSGIASTSMERQTNWQKYGALPKGAVKTGNYKNIHTYIY